MQLTIDTSSAQPAELAALARFLQDLAALRTAPERVTSKVIEPADRPDSGKAPAPAIVTAASRAAQTVVAPPAPPAPSLPDPAAVFAQMPLVPAVPTAPSVPAIPPFAGVPPAAPSVPTPPTAPVVPGGVSSVLELDVRGLPWDGRIHASARTKNNDGSWRQRRGINDEAMLRRIENELLMAVAARAPTASGGVPSVPAVDASIPAAFGPFMERVSNLIVSKQTTPDAVNAALREHLGMPTMVGLATRPDLLPAAWGVIQTLLAA